MEQFRAKIITSFADDGSLTHEDLHAIEHLRIQLGLSIKESKSLIRLSGLKSASVFKHCPYCGENLQHPNHPIE